VNIENLCTKNKIMNGIDEQFFGEIAELNLQMESFRQ
jgi:hypothetical protein